MKKAIKALAPGDILTYAKERFVVLENQGDGVFVLTEGKVGDSPFQAKDIVCRLWHDHGPGGAADALAVRQVQGHHPSAR